MKWISAIAEVKIAVSVIATFNIGNSLNIDHNDFLIGSNKFLEFSHKTKIKKLDNAKIQQTIGSGNTLSS